MTETFILLALSFLLVVTSAIVVSGLVFNGLINPRDQKLQNAFLLAAIFVGGCWLAFGYFVKVVL